MKEDISVLLESAVPSERFRALDYLRADPTLVKVEGVRRALIAESVPAIRNQLTQIIRSMDSARLAEDDHAIPVDGEVPLSRERATLFEDDVVKWMRHELTPVVGIIRFAGNRELENFSGSDLDHAIQLLVSRIDNVESLVRSAHPPRLELTSLSEIVNHSITMTGLPSDQIRIEEPDSSDDSILTDSGLFSLMISNVLRNALEAVRPLKQDPLVHVSFEVSGRGFWINVVNRFQGEAFEMNEILGSGVSGKIGHQGQGVAIIRRVAQKLNYSFLCKGESGVARSVIRGPK